MTIRNFSPSFSVIRVRSLFRSAMIFAVFFVFFVFFPFRAVALDNSDIFVYVARGDVNALQSWVLNGGNLDVQDSRGNTPMILAAEDGNVDMITVLVNNGANVNLANQFGYTPLWAAVSNRHPLVIMALLNAGADSRIVNRYGSSAEEYVRAQGYADVYKYMTALPPSSVRQGPNSAGHIPLWEKRAISHIDAGRFTDAEFVLKATADQGDAYARYMLGKLYLDGGYMDLGIVSLSSAAEAGVLAAQIDLSVYYFETADRHPVYTALGFKYQKMAADNWYPPALLETGKCYMYGIGTQVDQQAAYKYFRLAAKLGLIDAYYFMGAQQYYGMGMQADKERGMGEMVSAAREGSGEAQAQLMRFKTEDIFDALVQMPDSKTEMGQYLVSQGARLEGSEGRCERYDISGAVHPDYGVYKLSLCDVEEGSALQLVFNVYRDMQPIYKEYLINYQMKRANVVYLVDGEQ